MAVTDRPRSGSRQGSHNGDDPLIASIHNRDSAAEAIKPLLSDEPQTLIGLARIITGEDAPTSGQTDIIRSGLAVLEARDQAIRHGRAGWTDASTATDAPAPTPQDVEYPYEFAIIRLDQMFVDETYQRPLTSLVNKIRASFDPVLFQTLALSDRGARHKPKRYALIDGQTRHRGATDVGVIDGPCIVYKGLTVQQEASIFARLQTERKGMVSWHRFRADLRAEKPEALAIYKLMMDSGWGMSDRPNDISAVAALESAFRTDAFLLKRTLDVYRAGWTRDGWVPQAPHIRGMHFFFRHFPIGSRKKEMINDEKLVRRLGTASPDELKRKMFSAKDSALDGKGTVERFMAIAIQNLYLQSGR